MWIQSMHALYLKKYICAQAPPRTPAPLTETTFFHCQTCGLKTQLMRMPHQKTSRQIQRFSLQSIRVCVTLNLHERHWLSGVLGAGASSSGGVIGSICPMAQECWGRGARQCTRHYTGATRPRPWLPYSGAHFQDAVTTHEFENLGHEPAHGSSQVASNHPYPFHHVPWKGSILLHLVLALSVCCYLSIVRAGLKAKRRIWHPPNCSRSCKLLVGRATLKFISFAM